MRIPLTIASGVLLVSTLALAQPAKVGTTPQGDVLQTSAGKTLYVFDGDKLGHGESNCTKTCADLWPAFKVTDETPASKDWSVITRADGVKQWAYKGRPLYTWAKEGEQKTEGNSYEGNTWHAAKP